MCRPNIILSIALLLSLSLCSCSKGYRKGDSKPRYVRVERVSMVDYIDRDFAGMATADDAVNLAFKLSGQVLSVDVAKGDYVKKGVASAVEAISRTPNGQKLIGEKITLLNRKKEVFIVK